MKKISSKTEIKLEKFVTYANSPQIGSFGEAIFFKCCQQKGMDIKSIHRGLCDFEVNN
jgi:hypothetical protein